MFKTSFSTAIIVAILAVLVILPTCSGSDGSCGPSLAHQVVTKW